MEGVDEGAIGAFLVAPGDNRPPENTVINFGERTRVRKPEDGDTVTVDDPSWLLLTHG